MDAATRIQNESTKMMERLDKSCMRKLQVDMHTCSAKCCSDTTISMDEVQRCLNNCAAPVERVQSFVQSEIENFQNRLTRCVTTCQDEIQDKMGSGGITQKLRAEGEACVSKCADNFIAKLPELEKRIKDNISRYT